MKLFCHTCLLLSLLLFSGCGLINEDMSDCLPEENVMLLFTRMLSGSDQFQSCVQTVDVMVFDENGRFLLRKTVTQLEMEAFRSINQDGKYGTSLSLAPGKYRIVCWGNAGANSLYQNLTTSHNFSDASLHHTSFNLGVGKNYDPLYYAPSMNSTVNPEIFYLTVPEYGSQVSTINFTAAHDTVEIYIKGFSSINDPENDTPEVEVTLMSIAYDFQMVTQYDQPFCFVQNAQNTTFENVTLAGVQFITAQIGNDNPIQIHIKDPFNQEIKKTVNLKDFLADNSIALDPTDHDLISIMVEFNGLDVKVTLPSWNGKDVKPIF